MARQRATPFVLRPSSTTLTSTSIPHTIARSLFYHSAPLRRRYISSSSLVAGASPAKRSTFLSRLFTNPVTHLRQRKLHTSLRLRTEAPRPSPDPTAHLGSPKPTPSLSLSQRLKKLSREYGWSAFGVYMALSALDFPFCFLAVRVLGTERIGRWEHIIVNGVKQSIYYPLKHALGLDDGNVVEEAGHRIEDGAAQVLRGDVNGQEETKTNVGWGVEEAQEAHQAEASEYTPAL